MTKLAIPEEIHRAETAQAAAEAPDQSQAELRNFMVSATKAAIELSPIFTREIEARRLDYGQALVGVLLFASNFARKNGAKAADFYAAAEQAFSDAEELFATSAVAVLQAARALLLRPQAWIQGELAMKWVRDPTVPGGKKLVACHVDDTYASRWSLLGAIERCADARSNREKARDALVLAIRDAGWQFKPGSLPITVITEYNDHGWAPPLPEMQLPEAQDAGASAEAVANYEKTVAEMQRNYEEVVKPQWPKPTVPGRTREEVLAVLDRAIAISGDGR